MRIIILGGDGYLGWPTAMHLSSIGHKVAVVDNYLRRDLMLKEDVEPLYSTPNLSDVIRLKDDSNRPSGKIKSEHKKNYLKH